jgi:hypothetical protein
MATGDRTDPVTIATMANPKANAMLRTSIAVDPVPIPAMTAAPHPKKTSVNVPIILLLASSWIVPQC